MNTKAQEINWDEAPEGYPLWIVGKDGEGEWHREMHDRYIDRQDCYWLKESQGRTYEVYRKPEPIVWNGEGVPPAGSFVVYTPTDEFFTVYPFDFWLEGDILEVLAVRDTDGSPTAIVYNQRHGTSSGIVESEISPAPTKEETERKQAVNEMLDKFRVDDDKQELLRAICFSMYDAGYRKTQIVDKV